MEDSDLIRWAVEEIRQLDEACRWGIPDFEPMNSDEMGYLQDLEDLAERLEADDDS